MKIYVLYEDPFNEGWNVHGVFSTEEKANTGRDVLSRKANYELFIEEFELDFLERFFERAKLPSREYSGYYVGRWTMSPCGLDSFVLSDNAKKDHILDTNGRNPSCFVTADSLEEAEEKANELLEMLKDAPKDERGWRWVEK